LYVRVVVVVGGEVTEKSHREKPQRKVTQKSHREKSQRKVTEKSHREKSQGIGTALCGLPYFPPHPPPPSLFLINKPLLPPIKSDDNGLPWSR